jgi:hypothetical protein
MKSFLNEISSSELSRIRNLLRPVHLIQLDGYLLRSFQLFHGLSMTSKVHFSFHIRLNIISYSAHVETEKLTDTFLYYKPVIKSHYTNTDYIEPLSAS